MLNTTFKNTNFKPCYYFLFFIWKQKKKNNSIRIQQTGAVVTETSRPFLVVVFSEILKDLNFAHLKMVSESFN